MKVTLRKAAALQASLAELISSTVLNTELVVSIHESENLDSILAQAYSTLEKDYNRVNLLNEVYYDLRKLVSAKNAEMGVDDLLSDMNRLTKEISNLTRLAACRPQKVNVAKATMDKLKASENGVFNSDTVQVSLFSEEAIVFFKNQLKERKKEKEHLKEKLLSKNMFNEIELTAKMQETLENEGLL